jgi:hypothetical protein
MTYEPVLVSVRCEPHLPRLYRYRVGSPGFRVDWNCYRGTVRSAYIGAYVVVGRYAYCVKWGRAV